MINYPSVLASRRNPMDMVRSGHEFYSNLKQAAMDDDMDRDRRKRRSDGGFFSSTTMDVLKGVLLAHLLMSGAKMGLNYWQSPQLLELLRKYLNLGGSSPDSLRSLPDVNPEPSEPPVYTV